MRCWVCGSSYRAWVWSKTKKKRLQVSKGFGFDQWCLTFPLACGPAVVAFIYLVENYVYNLSCIPPVAMACTMVWFTRLCERSSSVWLRQCKRLRKPTDKIHLGQVLCMNTPQKLAPSLIFRRRKSKLKKKTYIVTRLPHVLIPFSCRWCHRWSLCDASRLPAPHKSTSYL